MEDALQQPRIEFFGRKVDIHKCLPTAPNASSGSSGSNGSGGSNGFNGSSSHAGAGSGSNGGSAGNAANAGNPQYRLFVGGLDDSFTEEMIQMALTPFGEVKRVNIIKQTDGRTRGFAFVNFSEQRPVDRLIQLQSLNINGKRVVFGSANVKKNKGMRG